jgi:hypothetical protein
MTEDFMNAEKVLKRLYNFFMGFGIFIFIGSLVELTALRHFNEELQFVPFVLCGLGIILAALMLIKPTAGMQMLLNFGMWVIAAGGIVGTIIHVSGNLEELLEGGRSAAFGQIIMAGLGGRNPLLAPGILTMAAAMILAVSYAMPVKKEIKK